MGVTSLMLFGLSNVLTGVSSFESAGGGGGGGGATGTGEVGSDSTPNVVVVVVVVSDATTVVVVELLVRPSAIWFNKSLLIGGGGGTVPSATGVTGATGVGAGDSLEVGDKGTSIPSTANLNFLVGLSCFLFLSRLEGSNNRPVRGVALKSFISFPTTPDLTVLLISSIGDRGECTTMSGDVTEGVALTLLEYDVFT